MRSTMDKILTKEFLSVKRKVIRLAKKKKKKKKNKQKTKQNIAKQHKTKIHTLKKKIEQWGEIPISSFKQM